MLGAYDGEGIVGRIGFRRAVGPKDAHKGFVWGFYVEPEHRRHGVGSALLSALLDAARGVVEQVTLSVVEQNAAAITLYDRVGFVRYGLEPRALKSASGYSNEVLMILFLEGSAPHRVPEDRNADHRGASTRHTREAPAAIAFPPTRA